MADVYTLTKYLVIVYNSTCRLLLEGTAGRNIFQLTNTSPF